MARKRLLRMYTAHKDDGCLIRRRHCCTPLWRLPASKSRHKKTAIETVNPPAKMMKAALGKKKARKSSS